jgi:hypothetical protein
MLSRLLAFLSFVPTLAHELTHYLVARLGSDKVAFRVDLDSQVQVCKWSPIESRTLRALAFLAPTIAGSVVLGLWIAVGDPVEGFELLGVVALGVYTVPSTSDIKGALGRQAAQANKDRKYE